MTQSRDNALSQKLYNCVGDLGLYAPNIQIRAIHKKRKVIDVSFGDHYPYFDLASLTKIIFTASLWMQIKDRSTLSFEDEAKVYIPWWKNKRKVLIRDLLSHRAGLDWWKPLYKKMGTNKSPDEAWAGLKSLLKNEQSSSNSKSVYSDLDLFYLGFISEELFQKSLLDQWEDVQNLFDFKSLNFHVKNSPKEKLGLFAPTEFCSWRGKHLQGQVHDENCFALGGVAPHAGLFGGMDDLEIYVRGLLEKGLFRESTLKTFTQRQTPRSIGDFGYLFMKPTKGSASCGRHFSDESFGHTGFTGTSIWIDPKKDLSVMILSNRVFTGREVGLFPLLRPVIHDFVVQLIS